MSTIKLGVLVSIIGGGTPDRSNPDFWGGDIPWATVKDFKSLEISSTMECITDEGLKGSAANIAASGSIIVPTRMALGKAAINTVPVAINQDLKALRVLDPEVLDRDYLFRFLLSKATYLESQGQGATVKGITLNVLRDLDVPVPPILDQQRIATILDKADRLRRKRQEAIRLADEFLKAVFFERFAEKPRSKVLTDYCDFLAGFAFKSDQYIDPRDGVRLLRGINVGIDRFEWGDSAGYPLTAVSDLARYRLEHGDVVLAMDRPWISAGLKCAAVDELVAGSYLVQRVARLRPKQQGMSAFIMNCLRGNDFKSHCRITETTIPHISPKDFATFPVPTATDAELKSFADIATRIQRVATKAGRAAISTDELTSSLQATIFNMH